MLQCCFLGACMHFVCGQLNRAVGQAERRNGAAELEVHGTWAPSSPSPGWGHTATLLPALQVRVIELSEPQGWVVVSLPPDEEPE